MEPRPVGWLARILLSVGMGAFCGGATLCAEAPDPITLAAVVGTLSAAAVFLVTCSGVEWTSNDRRTLTASDIVFGTLEIMGLFF